ncbi:MAG TPA: ABC transporter permease [Reyranella sp.]|jgi:peptide/nickel transport system permease protein
MIRLVLQRVALGFLTIFLVSILIFAGTEILPGDVATAVLGQSATPDAVEAMRRSLGLHDPAVVRYLRWLGALLSGDVGTSLTTGRAVGADLWLRLKNTFFLAGVAAAIAVPLALLLGITTAIFRDTLYDRLVNIVALAAISLPEFFIGYLLILLFAVQMGWLPSLATVSPEMGLGERLTTIALPTATLVLAVLAYMMRMTRTAVLDVMARPYIEMAVLKGVPPARVVLQHALPNALAPIIQVIAFNLAYLVVGVVLVEVVFVYPGIGQYLVDAVAKRDVTVVQACGLVFAATYVGLNVLADILVILTNPRLRHAR